MNREVSIPAKCPTHPGYKMKRKPTGHCQRCMDLWEAKCIDYYCWLGRMPGGPAPQLPEHPEYGELIDRWIGRKRV